VLLKRYLVSISCTLRWLIRIGGLKNILLFLLLENNSNVMVIKLVLVNFSLSRIDPKFKLVGVLGAIITTK
jgi:hypothetical protein